MRLLRATIEGFRSLATSVDLPLRPELTCLIGANEHGKSNILNALSFLDGGEFEEFDRHVKSKSDSHPDLTFELTLSPKEVRALIKSIRDEVQKLDEDDPGTPKVSKLFAGAISKLTGDVSPRWEMHVKADSSRHLTAGGVVFTLDEAGVPETRKRPIQLWYEGNVPTVLLFDPTDDLVDSISLQELRAEKNKPFEGLLKLAGAWDSVDDLFGNERVAQRELIYAGRRLTRKVRQIWSQGAGHKFHFSQSNGQLHIAIEDPGTFDAPSQRSLGFKSFFSFYLSLFAETEDVDPEGYILLFDEPGIHLHPQGQKDLLRELRKLSRSNQIVYATHSPFMIDRNDLSATLLVKKGTARENRGTRILTRPYGENWAPLNAALGISPADAFYPADRSLLVEGRSDRLYVNRYMSLCQSQTKADLNYLTIHDAEQRSALPQYIRPLLAGDRRIVVLSDGDQGGDDLARHLRKAAGTRKNQLRFIDLRRLLRSAKDVSIEDILPFDELGAAVRDYVATILKRDVEVDASAIRKHAEKMTMGNAIGRHLTDLGVLSEPAKLSRTSVADLYCKRNLAIPDPSSPTLLLCKQIAQELDIID